MIMIIIIILRDRTVVNGSAYFRANFRLLDINIQPLGISFYNSNAIFDVIDIHSKLKE